MLDRPLGEPVRAGEHRQDRPQARAERPGRDARREFGAGGGPAAGAGQLVEAVFIDVGTDGRDLSDLVSQGIGIVSLQCGATALALRRLDLEGLSKLFGWDQRPGVSLVTGLSSALAPGRRDRRSPLELDGGRIGGGRLGRIGGVEVEPRLQLGDPPLQRGEDVPKAQLAPREGRCSKAIQGLGDEGSYRRYYVATVQSVRAP